MPKPQMDEYWIARVQYWPGREPVVDVVYIFYAWQNGEVDFIPCMQGEGDPICSMQCAQFELLEKIDMEKYK